MLKHKYIWIISLLSVFVILVCNYYYDVSLSYLFIVFFFWLGLTSWGSFDIRLNYFIKAYSKNTKTLDQKIALTFDDGPHPITNQVLDLLDKYEFKATFFCIGKQIEMYPDIFKRIHESGHTIGNHTYSHTSKMGFLSKKKIIQEITICNRMIVDRIGKKPKLYRPPFGVTNPDIALALNELKMDVIGWNVRSLDTILTNEHAILNRVLPRINPGSIVLFHDNSERTVHVLEQLLHFMKHNKIESVTVDELLNLEPYEN